MSLSTWRLQVQYSLSFLQFWFPPYFSEKGMLYIHVACALLFVKRNSDNSTLCFSLMWKLQLLYLAIPVSDDTKNMFHKCLKSQFNAHYRMICCVFIKRETVNEWTRELDTSCIFKSIFVVAAWVDERETKPFSKFVGCKTKLIH